MNTGDTPEEHHLAYFSILLGTFDTWSMTFQQILHSHGSNLIYTNLYSFA